MRKQINLLKHFSIEFLDIFKHIKRINPILSNHFPNDLKKGYLNWFWLKGGKGSAKTYSWIKLVILLMLIDNHFSYVFIMDTKGENYKKTFQLIKRVLRDIEQDIPNVDKMFEFYRSESRLSVILKNGQWEQVLEFASIEEIGTGGWTPPINTYYGGFLWDESILKKDAKKDTKETMETYLGLLRNFSLSLTRYLKDYNVPSLINCITNNPFVGDSPVLEKHNQFLPDDIEEQVIKLYRKYEDYENGNYFATISLESNPFASIQDIMEVDKNIIDFDVYLTEKYGINSYGRDTVLGYLWNRVEKKQNSYSDIKEYVVFSIGVDVGAFGKNSAKTAMVLIAFHATKHYFTVLEEFVYNPKKHLPLSPDQLAREMIMKLIEWENKHHTFSYTNLQFIPLRIDPTDGGHSYFQNLMLQQYNYILNNGDFYNPSLARPLQKLEFQLATEKWSKSWDAIERNAEWENMVGSGLFIPFKVFSPELYKELPNLKVKDGKRIDIDTDTTQAVEYALSEVMRNYFSNVVNFQNKDIREEISFFLKSKGVI